MAGARPRLRLRRTDRLFGTDPDGHPWIAWGLCTPGEVSESTCLLCGRTNLPGGWTCVDANVRPEAVVCDRCVVVMGGRI